MATCDRIGCEEEAVFVPILTLQPEGPARGEAILATGLEVCLLHQQEMTIEMLVSDDAWDGIAAAFELIGKVKPDRSSLAIHWEPVPFVSTHNPAPRVN